MTVGLQMFLGIFSFVVGGSRGKAVTGEVKKENCFNSRGQQL